MDQGETQDGANGDGQEPDPERREACTGEPGQSRVHAEGRKSDEQAELAEPEARIPEVVAQELLKMVKSARCVQSREGDKDQKKAWKMLQGSGEWVSFGFFRVRRVVPKIEQRHAQN